jgi:hypothetical protein
MLDPFDAADVGRQTLIMEQRRQIDGGRGGFAAEIKMHFVEQAFFFCRVAHRHSLSPLSRGAPAGRASLVLFFILLPLDPSLLRMRRLGSIH